MLNNFPLIHSKWSVSELDLVNMTYNWYCERKISKIKILFAILFSFDLNCRLVIDSQISLEELCGRIIDSSLKNLDIQEKCVSREFLPNLNSKKDFYIFYFIIKQYKLF